MRPTLALLLVAALAGAASADPAVAFHVVDDGGHKKIVIDTPVDVNGRAPRPEVAVLGASLRPDYVWPLVEQSMLDLVLATVQRAPFVAAPGAVPAGGRP